MNDRKILAAAIADRGSWEVIRDNLELKEVGSDTGQLLKYVADYYGNDTSARAADVEILIARLGRTEQNPKHIEALSQVLKSLPDVSAINIAREIVAQKAHNRAQELSVLLSKGEINEQVLRRIDDFRSLIGSSGNLVGDDQDSEEVVESFTVKDLVEKSFDRKNLIQLWPRALNEHLDGGARPGHHILVFAPTEMGKTLVLINMVAGFTKQGLRTLYVGNEDPVADLQMRYINRITGRTKDQVLSDPTGTQAILEKRNYQNVIFAPLAPGTFPKIRRLVEKYKPHVVVLDQLRNIDVDSENRTQALEKAATEARNLAKGMGVLVVSVSQASDSASGKRILTRGDVDSSNVGIPGQADVMIGIGATEEDEQHNRRTFSFPKNKISGKHGGIMVEIIPQLSMVKEQEKPANDPEFEGRKASQISRAA